MNGPRVRIRIDGATAFDGNPGDWVSAPPDVFKDMIKPGYRPEPWMKAIMITFTEATLTEQSVDISVLTHTKRDNAPGWSMQVVYR